MNIYEKLMKTRCSLIDKGIKKTGLNKFNKTPFYQLEDFLPQAQKLMLENKLAGFCNINEKAVLKIVDFEKEDSFLEFSIDVKEAQIKGAQAIQNLGGTITYLRRYLWMLALEITESEEVDEQERKTYDVNSEDYKKENKTNLENDRSHFCEVCKSEITEEQSRSSLAENNAKLCKKCISGKLETAIGISNVLQKHELNDLLKTCELYLKNKTATKNSLTIPLYDHLKGNKNYEGAVLVYLKHLIKEQAPNEFELIKDTDDLKSVVDMYKLTKE